MARNYTDYVGACVDAIKESPIPKTFARWTALSAVAGAVGRRVWFPMPNYDIGSNLFIILIASPGRNKSVSLILPFTKIFNRLTTPVGTQEEDHNFNSGLDEYGLRKFPLYLIQDRITPEKLAVDMAKITRMDLRLSNPRQEQFFDSSLTLVTSEFGTFMTRSERSLQFFLTDMWDSRETYSYKTKTAGEYIIEGPCLNWIACATPEQFVDNLPEDARSQGLLSRMLPIFYEGERIPQDLTQKVISEKSMPKALEGFGMARTGRIAHDMKVWLESTMALKKRGHVNLRAFKREVLRKIANPGELDQTIRAMADSGYIKVEGNIVFPSKSN
jgi:hypothetical protein